MLKMSINVKMICRINAGNSIFSIPYRNGGGAT